MPRKRNGRPGPVRNTRTRPAIHTGTSTGLTSSSWNGMNPIRPPCASPPAMEPAMSSSGQPLRACHTR